jgi:hypothetical protein
MLAALAAPAIVRVENLMVLPQAPKIIVPELLPVEYDIAFSPVDVSFTRNSLLTIDQITREAVQLFTNSNAFLQSMNRQYDEEFFQEGAKLGQSLRIQLPKDFVLADGPKLSLADPQPKSSFLEWSRKIAA